MVWKIRTTSREGCKVSVLAIGLMGVGESARAILNPDLSQERRGLACAGVELSESLVDRISGHLLWDVDPRTVDVAKHADFLIRRVMERGNREDVKLVWNYYGADRVREALVSAPSLSKKTVAFFANQFDLPREAFRSHRRGGAQWDR